ncbi:MAG TPA: SRPBCC family protein [Longimicrobiaceae bacterium]|nr:SRPBCC family protein [Longimicrobiaceae bacterium]
MPGTTTEERVAQHAPRAPAGTAERVPRPGGRGGTSIGARNVGEAERLLSVAAGAALTVHGLRARSASGLAEALVGALLLGRGATGRCPVYGELGISTAEVDGSRSALPEKHTFHARRSFTIQRPPGELYAHWRRLENLPSFMKHLESVTELSETRSRWVTEGPAGRRVEWEAEITEDVPGERIAWRSVEGSRLANRGAVSFRALPAGRGTVVDAEIEYAPPAGALGEGIATLFRENAEVQMRDDLRRFKNVMETGEYPTIDGQTSCRRNEGGES